jgi:hypothetical protein
MAIFGHFLRSPFSLLHSYAESGDLDAAEAEIFSMLLASMFSHQVLLNLEVGRQREPEAARFDRVKVAVIDAAGRLPRQT